VNSQRVRAPRLAEEDTMRHSVVTTRLVREARAALDDEAAKRPVRQKAEPRPPREAPSGRLVSVARRVRALAARALAARAT
jgi:hypothetical protein